MGRYWKLEPIRNIELNPCNIFCHSDVLVIGMWNPEFPGFWITSKHPLQLFCGILNSVPGITPVDFKALYAPFDSAVSVLDCGKKCAPYNEHGAPFCCDTKHTVPTAYLSEWIYLKTHTNLWHLWESEESNNLRTATPEGQVLIECLGHERCQRDYRSITCRAFPFAPYITRDGKFIGLSYYWQYEDRCWVISNLDQVTRSYREEFVDAYDSIFEKYPREFDAFKYHSNLIRQEFGYQKRAIPLLHRNGYTYKISPRNDRLRRVDAKSFPKHGPYKIAALMPFPDELSENIVNKQVYTRKT